LAGADRGPVESEFALLTDKQAAVLGLLANGRTTKEIATALVVSESAVNRRIELLRTRFGGITRLELARRYRDWRGAENAEEAGITPRVESDRQFLHLAALDQKDEQIDEDDADTELAFRDSLEMSIETPWNRAEEPQVVPGVLDGDHAMLTRGAVIAIMLFAIIASLVLGLAAAKALTDAVG